MLVDIGDDGPGIPEESRRRIFEPFYTTKASGSGYGLYLASEILREHGGKITAKNGDGGGAVLSGYTVQQHRVPFLSKAANGIGRIE